uniref:Major sperm protein n=1 Tax=Panagrellus redivivus TaxID=6233 RepID=A0A7E4V8D6_PANRE
MNTNRDSSIPKTRRSFEHFRTKWPNNTGTGPRRSTAAQTQSLRRSTMSTAGRLTGPLETVPSKSIYFNAPFEDEQSVVIKITNTGGFRVGWTVKPTNTLRIRLHPSSGILAPQESRVVTVTCQPFRSGKDVRPDVIIVEWTNTPDDLSMVFEDEWLEGNDGRRKNILVLYNL